MTENDNTGLGGIPVVVPARRYAWGAIFVGLFTALSVMLVLSVLGIAIGLSSVDRNDDPRNFGIGAGIWGAISALIAFFAGGYAASWARPTILEGNGMLQGALTWMVSIVLMVYLTAGTIGAVSRTAGSVAATGAEVGAQAGLVDEARQRFDQAGPTTQNAVPNVTGRDVERAAEYGAAGAWGTLVALLLSFGAAVGGGYLGAIGLETPSRRRD